MDGHVTANLPDCKPHLLSAAVGMAAAWEPLPSVVLRSCNEQRLGLELGRHTGRRWQHVVVVRRVNSHHHAVRNVVPLTRSQIILKVPRYAAGAEPRRGANSATSRQRSLHSSTAIDR